ncbi:hypothetical protein FHR22_000024 [Sphingopyxis panaciterrae]|uniref:hypothetical protein n=1 Tax=Sphingopyxis panaciterrae TaxID=363841 RepID=UPI0014247EEF|nr:hypothetical protein [Sphingopyxis panaciterrae]NIJ35375.1 hypothetical protein [Sphingopyxis panaciterrae]
MSALFQKILAVPFSWRQAVLSRKRLPLSETEFCEIVHQSGGHKEAALFIWNYLEDWIYIRNFTPYPDDDFQSIYGIAEEERDEDLILRLLESVGLSQNSSEIYFVSDPANPLSLARCIKNIETLSKNV